jgi:polysaccharide biosynthesis transport protein
VTPTHTGGLEPRDYLRVLRRRRWTIVAGVLGVVCASLVFSFLQTPVYSASTRVLLRPSVSVFDASAQRAVSPVLVQTEMQLIESQQVRALVGERLGREAPKISASAIGDTSIVEVTAESTDAKEAPRIADAYVDAYIQFNQTQTTDAIVESSKEIQGRLDALQREIADLDGKLAAIPGCTAPNPPRECDQRQRLTQDRDALLGQVVPLRTRLNELQVGASRNSGPQVIARATVPTEPTRPKPIRNAVLGLGVGLLFGVGLAFATEHFDDSIRSKEDLERAASDLPVLGTIPAVPAWKDRSETVVMSQAEPNSAVAEAYRSLRTAVRFTTLDRSVGVIQVTSPNVSEGKSTTVANLAVALARAGERVVVVCCDLRRPRIHEFFGLPNKVGFTSVMLGTCSLGAALQAVPGQERLLLLASGELPPNPSELLSSNRASQVFATLQKEASVVLVDCPPVLPVTDAAALSSRMDATLLVATVGTTAKHDVERSLELLRQVNAPLLGMVLNGTTAESGYGYVYAGYTLPAPNGNGAKSNGSTRPKKARARRKAANDD